jgi:hypothetical protein
MKWYNKTKELMIDLDLVSFYYYNKLSGILYIVVDGCEQTILHEYGSSELFDSLKNMSGKQLLTEQG